jgi:hypothetical protein
VRRLDAAAAIAIGLLVGSGVGIGVVLWVRVAVFGRW